MKDDPFEQNGSNELGINQFLEKGKLEQHKDGGRAWVWSIQNLLEFSLKLYPIAADHVWCRQDHIGTLSFVFSLYIATIEVDLQIPTSGKRFSAFRQIGKSRWAFRRPTSPVEKSSSKFVLFSSLSTLFNISLPFYFRDTPNH